MRALQLQRWPSSANAKQLSFEREDMRIVRAELAQGRGKARDVFGVRPALAASAADLAHDRRDRRGTEIVRVGLVGHVDEAGAGR